MYFRTAIVCENLTVPLNGAIEYSEDRTLFFSLGTQANYTCLEHYTLKVPNEAQGEDFYTRTCVGNYSSSRGWWTGDDPGCVSEYQCALLT